MAEAGSYFRIRRLTIIGVGLIGGSLARALRRAGICDEVIGCSRDADHLARAEQLGVIDGYTTKLAEAVAGADMIMVAVPLNWGHWKFSSTSIIGWRAD